MSDPNSHQVGGSHYQADYQHWDFVHDVLQDRYYEGCITKYGTRWAKKNGVQDVQKAIHYLDKLEALHLQNKILDMDSLWVFSSGSHFSLPPYLAQKRADDVHRYIQANNLRSMEEQNLMSLASCWSGEAHLKDMRACLLGILSMAEAHAELAHEMRQENP